MFSLLPIHGAKIETGTDWSLTVLGSNWVKRYLVKDFRNTTKISLVFLIFIRLYRC